MKFEDWKELMIKKDNLEILLYELVLTRDRYLEEERNKWLALQHCSALTENFKEAVRWEKEETDHQKERYEWLFNYIIDKFGKSNF